MATREGLHLLHFISLASLNKALPAQIIKIVIDQKINSLNYLHIL